MNNSAIKYFSAFIFLFFFQSNAQTARLKGVLLDEFNQPIEGANIKVENKGTVSNSSGFYQIAVPANKRIESSFKFNLRSSGRSYGY